MSILFKDLYSKAFYRFLAQILTQTISKFDQQKFMTLIFCEQFNNYELKQRVSHTAMVLHLFMPAQFTQAVKILLGLVKRFEDFLKFNKINI